MNLALFGFVIQVGPGGLSLGLAMKASPLRILGMGLSSLVGALVGRYLLLLPFAIAIGDRFSGNPPESYLLSLLMGTGTGIGVGLALAFGSDKRAEIDRFVLMGGLGFGIGMLVTTPFYYDPLLQFWLGYMLAGAIGGGVLGAAVGRNPQMRFSHE
jgi:hypothetical protein